RGGRQLRADGARPGGRQVRRHHPRPHQPARHHTGTREPALRAQRDRAAPRARQGRRAGARLRRRGDQGRLRHARRRGRQRRGQGRAGGTKDGMTTELEVGLYIFMLAGFLGYHLITRVPPLLHTPLMSATNAIAAISLVGSLVVAGSDYSQVPNGWVCTLLGFAAVTCSSTNAFGGFLITAGMLVAVVGRLFHPHVGADRWIALGFAIGAVIGGTMGLRIPMTAVPQRTALSHSLGALAACLVGVSEYFRYQGELARVTLTAL